MYITNEAGTNSVQLKLHVCMKKLLKQDLYITLWTFNVAFVFKK